jgi:hypothetical protein
MVESARVEQEQRAQGAHPAAANTAAQQAYAEVTEPGLQALEARLREQRRLARAGIALAHPPQHRTDSQYRVVLAQLVNADFYGEAASRAREQWQAKASGLAEMTEQRRNPATLGWWQTLPTEQDIASMTETVEYTRTAFENLRTERPRAREAERAITAVVAEPLDRSLYELDTAEVKAAHVRALAKASAPDSADPVLAAIKVRLADLLQQSRQRQQTTPTTPAAPTTSAVRARNARQESHLRPQPQPPRAGVPR